MSNSLSDQLLKAGLITQQQIDQAEQVKQQQKEQAKARQQQKTALHAQRPKGKPTGKSATKPAPQRQNVADSSGIAPSTPNEINKPQKKRSNSDLAQFYRERDSIERQEREAAERLKREKAERKKQTRLQVRELITANLLNVEDASIRYNFVVGETVKYLFVTATQQQALAEGHIAITFMDGKRCLISLETAEKIAAIDPDKLIVINKDGDPLLELDPATEAELQALAAAEQAKAAAQAESEPESTSSADPVDDNTKA